MTNLAKHLRYNARVINGNADDDSRALLDAAKNLSDSFNFLLTRLDPQKQMVRYALLDSLAGISNYVFKFAWHEPKKSNIVLYNCDKMDLVIAFVTFEGQILNKRKKYLQFVTQTKI